MQIQYYCANGHDRALDPDDLSAVSLDSESLLWINGTFAEIAALELPEEIGSAIPKSTLLPGMQRVNDKTFSFAVSVYSETMKADPPVLYVTAGADWIISYGDELAQDFGEFLAHDMGETRKGALSGATLAAALLLDRFELIHAGIAAIEREVDRVEERTLLSRDRRNTLRVMAVMRRRISRMREVLGTYRPVVQALTRVDFLPELTEDDRDHLLHMRMAFERLEDSLVRARETVVGSFELFSARVSQDTNRILRTLTFVTIGVGLIGSLAGIFGMNFELHIFEQTANGFYIVTATMAAIFAMTAALAFFTYRRP